MARITDQVKSRTAFGQQFSEVLDRTEALRGISAEISPRPVESDDEGFVAETIKSFTDPIIGAAKATIQAPGALLESSDLTEEATEIKLELDSLLKQKGFMADEEFRSQLGILKARNENLGSKVDVFDEALPEQEQVARDFGASMLITASFGAGKIVAGVAGKTVIQAFPKLSRIARGGIAGSSLFAADAVQEGKNFQDTLGEAGIGFVIGGAGIAQPFIGFILDHYWTGQMLDGIRSYPISAYKIAMSVFPLAFLVAFVLGLFLKKVEPKKNLWEKLLAQ